MGRGQLKVLPEAAQALDLARSVVLSYPESYPSKPELVKPLETGAA